MATTTTWTLEDLAALEDAIAKGAKRVKYKDKEIEYRSVNEMFTILAAMKKALGCAPKTTKCQIIAKKGLC